MMENQGQPVEIREYIAILLNRLPVILIVFGLVLGLGSFYTATRPKIYRATSKVRVLQQKIGLLQLPLPTYSYAPDVETAVQLMTSNDVLEKACKYIREHYTGSENLPPLSPEDLVKAIRVEAIRNTDVVQIVASSTDPNLAMLMANAIANVFVEEIDDVAKRESRETRIFLEQQLYGDPRKGTKGLEKELNEIENKLRDFQKQEGLVDLDKETSSLIERLANLKADIETCDISTRVAQARLERVENILKQQGEWVVSGKTLGDDPYISQLRQEIARTQLQLLTLQEKYTDTNPQVLEVKKNLDNLKKELEGRLKQRVMQEVGENLTLNPLQSERVSAQLEIYTNEAKKKALENYIKPLEDQLSTLPDKSLIYARLQRERQTLSTLYSDLLQKLQEARVRETTTRGNAYIAETASLPTTPTYPQKKLSILLSFILALGLGIASAFLAEYIDDTVKTPLDAERDLRLAVLGNIPRIDITEEGELPILTDPRSSSAEAFRTLRSNIKFSQLDKPIQILLITSSLKGEGKTLVASNLALAFSTAGARTILIDCDLRNPAVHRLFNKDRDRGLTNVLVGESSLEESVIEVTDNLFILPSGPIPPNPVEMLDSQRMRDILAELSKKYDVVIIDSPPVLGMADAVILSAMTDGTILVARSGYTRRGIFRQASQVLERAGAKILGIALNFLAPRRGYYHYYYYYYYGYGEKKRKKEV